MFYQSFCASVQGIEAHIISVEVDVCDGADSLEKTLMLGKIEGRREGGGRG